MSNNSIHGFKLTLLLRSPSRPHRFFQTLLIFFLAALVLSSSVAVAEIVAKNETADGRTIVYGTSEANTYTATQTNDATSHNLVELCTATTWWSCTTYRLDMYYNFNFDGNATVTPAGVYKIIAKSSAYNSGGGEAIYLSIGSTTPGGSLTNAIATSESHQSWTLCSTKAACSSLINASGGTYIRFYDQTPAETTANTLYNDYLFLDVYADAQPPTTGGTTWDTHAWQSSDATGITLTCYDPSGDSQSGCDSAKNPLYCTQSGSACTPNTDYSAPFDITCGSTCTTYLSVQSSDLVGNAETVKSAIYQIDKQAPTAGTVTPSSTDYAGAYVDGTFNLDTSFNDNGGSGVSSCQYTTDGSTWLAASGTTACSKTGITCTDGQSLTLNMRATDALSWTGTATQVTRTCDTGAPTTSDNAPSAWQTSEPTVTLTTSGETGRSGVANTKYCIDTDATPDCTPTLTYSTPFTVPCTDYCPAQYVRYYSTDNVGNVESTKTSVQIKIDKSSPVIGTPEIYSSLYGSYYRGSTADIRMTASDGGSGINTTSCEYTLTGAGGWPGWSAAYSSPYCQQTGVSVGSSISLGFRVKNVAGGMNTSASYVSYTQDSAVDTVETTGTPSSWTNQSTNADVSCTDSQSGCVSASRRLQVVCDSCSCGSPPGDYNLYTISSLPTSVSSYSKVCAAAKDNVGNYKNNTTGIKFKVDQTKPTLTAAPVINSSNIYLTYYSGTTIDIRAPATDSGGAGVSGCKYSLNGGSSYTAASWDGSSYCYALGANTGGVSVTINFSVTDAAGNENTGTNTAYTVDNTKPAVYVTGAPSSWSKTDQSAGVTCDDGSGSGCSSSTYRLIIYTTVQTTCPADYASYGSTQPPQTISQHSWVCAAVKDNLGNMNNTSVPVEFKVDKNAPTFDITSANNTWNMASFSVSTSDTDTGDSALLTCKYRVESNSVQTRGWTARTCNDANSMTVTVGSGQDCQNDGTNTCLVMINATDNAGNIGTNVSRLYRIDFTKPNVMTTWPPNGTNFTSGNNFNVNTTDTDATSGINNAQCYYRVESNGVATTPGGWATRTCNSVPSFSLTVAPSTGDCRDNGVNVCNVTIKAQDTAGNINYTSRYYSITGISTVPTASVVSWPTDISTTWNKSNGTANVSCTPVSPKYCVGYAINISSTNPGSCPTVSSSYTIANFSPAYNIAAHSWVCAYVKDNASLEGFSSPVEFKVDKVLPGAGITSPAESTWEKAAFSVNMNFSDTGDSMLSTCRYRVVSNGVQTLGWTSAGACSGLSSYSNSNSISVGTSQNCDVQGSNMCRVEVNATDTAVSTSITYVRNFSIDWTDPTSTMTGQTPSEGSWQTESPGYFYVNVSDSDGAASSGWSQCNYNVSNSTGVTQQASRGCPNGNVTVTVGSGGFCNEQGTNKCTVRVWSVDALGQTSATATRNFSIDWSAPTSSVNTPAAGSWQNKSFTANLTYNDAISLSQCRYSVISDVTTTVNNVSAGACSAPTTTIPKSVSVGVGNDCQNEGSNKCTVYVRANDSTHPSFAEGTSRSFSIDWESPGATINSPAAGTWQIVAFTAVLNYTDTPSPSGSGLNTCEYKVVSNGATTVDWTSAGSCSGNFSTIINKQITIGSGKNCDVQGSNMCTVYVRANDSASGVSAVYGNTYNIDWTAPTGSILIENGATYANSTSVTLYLTFADADSGISQVRYSNDGVWDTEQWEGTNATRAWTLLSGDVEKTVWYQVKNVAGNTSTFTDNITLDTALPVIAITNAPASWTNSTVAVTDADVTCSDAGGSGCASATKKLKVYTTQQSVCPSDYSTYDLSLPQTLSQHSWVCAAIKDNAGNMNKTLAEFKIDRIAPASSISSPINSTEENQNFNVFVSDNDTGGDSILPYYCQYKVESYRTSWNQTRAWTNRTCDSPVGIKTTDIANGKTAITTSSTPLSGSTTLLTDGSTSSSPYINLNTGTQWIQVDLGASYSLSAVKLWHYWQDGRTYGSVQVKVSTNGLFSGEETTVFNGPNYTETSNGKLINFAPITARYIRAYSNGNSVNGNNHYVELRAYLNDDCSDEGVDKCLVSVRSYDNTGNVSSIKQGKYSINWSKTSSIQYLAHSTPTTGMLEPNTYVDSMDTEPLFGGSTWGFTCTVTSGSSICDGSSAWAYNAGTGYFFFTTPNSCGDDGSAEATMYNDFYFDGGSPLSQVYDVTVKFDYYSGLINVNQPGTTTTLYLDLMDSDGTWHNGIWSAAGDNGGWRNLNTANPSTSWFNKTGTYRLRFRATATIDTTYLGQSGWWSSMCTDENDQLQWNVDNVYVNITYSPVNRKFYSFDITPSSYVAIAEKPPSGANFDLYIYSDSGFTTLVASSTQTGDGVMDAVILNGHALGSSAIYYGKITRTSASGTFSVEAESDPINITDGSWYSGELTSSELFDLYEVYMTGTSDYTCRLNVTSGNLDPALRLNYSSGAVPTTSIKYINNSGAAVNESFTCTAAQCPNAGNYSLIAIGGQGSGNYTVQCSHDNVPPTTTMTCNGAACAGTWYTANITPTVLSCTDNPGGSGCSETRYKIRSSNDCTDPAQGDPFGSTQGTLYSGSFTYDTEGANYLCYASKDVLLNTETPRNSQLLKLDRTSPTTTIDVPTPANSTWRKSNITMYFTDADTGGSGLSTCYYTVNSSGTETVSSAARTCSATVNVSVGVAPNNCRNEGASANTCVVSVYSKDIGTLTSSIRSRNYSIDWSSPATDVTSPGAGSWQSANFSASLSYTDNSNLSTCEYRVVSNGTQTLGWTSAGACSGTSFTPPMTISVGTSQNCNVQGSNMCKVEVRANDTLDNNNSASPGNRFFSVDWTKPVASVSTSAGWKIANFDVNFSFSDTGGAGLQTCEYRIESNGTQTLGWTTVNGSCSNGYATITVGVAPNNCQNQAGNACAVFARATDAAGNNNSSYKNFSIDWSPPTSSFNAPAASSWFSANFTVDVSDSDTGSSGLDYSKCYYKVTSNGTETVSETARTCSTPSLLITVGAGKNCIDQGADKCVVTIYAKDNASNTGSQQQRSFGIDLTKPSSTFNQPPDGSTQSASFPINVSDTDTGGSSLSTCRYRVTSNGTVTKDWMAGATRTCNSVTSRTITVGAGQECRDNGANKCTVDVNATDGAGNIGDTKSKSFTIDFTGNEPTVNLTPVPSNIITTWNNTNAIANVTCSYQGSESNCNKSTYRVKVYSSNPSNCPAGSGYDTDYAGEPQPNVTITAVSWVCAAAKNNLGVAGATANPVKFLVDKIKSTSSISSPAAGSWQSSNFTLTLPFSDIDGNADYSKLSACYYRVTSNNSTTLDWTSAGSCSGSSSTNLTPQISVGTGQNCDVEGTGKCSIQVYATDAAGNIGNISMRNFSIDVNAPSVSYISALALRVEANGSGYAYVYFNNSTNYTIASGDYLEYDIYINGPQIKGGLDAVINDTGRMKNTGWRDQNNTNITPTTDLSSYASQTWYHRSFSIGNKSGGYLTNFMIAHEGGAAGNYTILLDNVKITNSSGTKTIIYENGTTPTDNIGDRTPSAKYVDIIDYPGEIQIGRTQTVFVSATDISPLSATITINGTNCSTVYKTGDIFWCNTIPQNTSGNLTYTVYITDSNGTGNTKVVSRTTHANTYKTFELVWSPATPNLPTAPNNYTMFAPPVYQWSAPTAEEYQGELSLSIGSGVTAKSTMSKWLPPSSAEGAAKPGCNKEETGSCFTTCLGCTAVACVNSCKWSINYSSGIWVKDKDKIITAKLGGSNLTEMPPVNVRFYDGANIVGVKNATTAYNLFGSINTTGTPSGKLISISRMNTSTGSVQYDTCSYSDYSGNPLKCQGINFTDGGSFWARINNPGSYVDWTWS
jgi:hypothetical protein